MIDIQKDTAVEGEEIEVNCTAMASKPATTIRWFKGNKELEGESCLAYAARVSWPWSHQGYLKIKTKAKQAWSRNTLVSTSYISYHLCP